MKNRMNPKLEPQQELKEFTDLALATYLSAIGHRISSINSSGNKSTFTFEYSKTLEKDFLAFYNREARVDPLTFAEIFRNLKALTRS